MTMKSDEVSSVSPAAVTGSAASDETNETLLPRNKHSKGEPAYESFMRAMDLAYGLKDVKAGKLRFVGIDGLDRTELTESFVIPPKVLANPGHDHPKLAIALAPQKAGEGGSVTGASKYHSPIFVRDVNRWQFAKDKLGKYSVDRLLGVEKGGLFEAPCSLADVLSAGEGLSITDETPVVEAVAILPIAEDGSFTTEFTPQIRFDIGDHNYYKISVVSQSGISKFAQLIQGQSTYDVQAIEHDQSMHNFSADFIPDMDEFSQMLVPSSVGHMVLVASPTENPIAKLWSGGFGNDFGSGFRFDPGPSRSMGGGGMFRGGGSIGGVDIGIGSKVGTGSLYSGNVTSSRNGNATIFHVRLLGVKPNDMKKLAANAGELDSAVDAYTTN